MQKTQVIDITRSYLPGDPNAIQENLINTDREDGEEKTYPIIPFEGKNILPTAYGYRSYFGVDSILVGDNVPANCDQIILFQTDQYENMLVAFTAAGIYTRLGAATAWTQSFALTDTWTATQTYKEYTWCVIENHLYIYRQGHTHVLKISYAGAFSSFVPSFLNMAGQMGIFRANGRLGFWDSANSVSWSSAFDFTDFTPNLETLVGNTIFLGVQGRIVNIKPHGEGFIIYCTKSVVGISYNTQGTMLWDAMTLTSAGGIGYPRAVTTGANDKEHFVFTSIGIFMIGHFNALSRQYDMQQIAPELYDYLKESREPVYLEVMGGRYLHFGLINGDYIDGIVSFTTDGITINTGDTAISWVEADIFAYSHFDGTPGASPTFTVNGTLYTQVADGSALQVSGTTFGSTCANVAAGNSLHTTADYLTNIRDLVSGDFTLQGFFTIPTLPDTADFIGIALFYTDVFSDNFFIGIEVNDVLAGDFICKLKIVQRDYPAAATVTTLLSDPFTFTPGIANFLRITKTNLTVRLQLNTALAATIELPQNPIMLDDIYSPSVRLFGVTEYGNLIPPEFFTSDILVDDLLVLRKSLFIQDEYTVPTEAFALTGIIGTLVFTFPEATFSLQSGSISPAYPTFAGSLVFDTQLKKWGKNANSYKALISLSPLNETQNQAISTTNFGIDSGILGIDSKIKQFAVATINSMLKYGKVGFYRQGFTDGFEIRLQFRIKSTGTITVEPSYDGKTVLASAILSEDFTEAVEHVFYFDRSARWFNIAISGQFDLTNLEFVGRISARR